jgi:hypothetical protein
MLSSIGLMYFRPPSGGRIMARRTDKTGKTGAGQLPAEIYKFPQSETGAKTKTAKGSKAKPRL